MHKFKIKQKGKYIVELYKTITLLFAQIDTKKADPVEYIDIKHLLKQLFLKSFNIGLDVKKRNTKYIILIDAGQVSALQNLWLTTKQSINPESLPFYETLFSSIFNDIDKQRINLEQLLRSQISPTNTDNYNSNYIKGI